MRKLLRRLSLFLIAVIALIAAWDVATYDAKAWQADYLRLKTDMAQGYANLDWMVEYRKLDLVALDRETTASIKGAHSRVRAFLALRRFVHAFRDPHLRLKLGERPIQENPPTSANTGSVASAEPTDPPAGADCAAAGYSEDDHGFRFPFKEMTGWTSLREGDFPIGLAGDVGVIRIAQFGEDRYLAACEKVFKAGMGERELQLAVRTEQQRKLNAALRELREKGASRLLVDVSGNGGGTEWVVEVIALMTDRPLTREGARVVAPRCDRSGVWRGEIPCRVLPDESERASLQGTGVWTGPVLILADARTGSASEDFVAWLQQNKVAKVIGERTVGAGCGYIDGGNRTQFRASPFDVMMPNCARFLDTGINEIEGIAPDIALPMQLDDAKQQAAALAAVLEKP